jgi:hypothetical protein
MAKGLYDGGHPGAPLDAHTAHWSGWRSSGFLLQGF